MVVFLLLDYQSYTVCRSIQIVPIQFILFPQRVLLNHVNRLVGFIEARFSIACCGQFIGGTQEAYDIGDGCKTNSYHNSILGRGLKPFCLLSTNIRQRTSLGKTL